MKKIAVLVGLCLFLYSPIGVYGQDFGDEGGFGGFEDFGDETAPAAAGEEAFGDFGGAPATGDEDAFGDFGETVSDTVDQVGNTITDFLGGVAQSRILTGQRVTDRISGRLLEDVYYKTVPQSEIDAMNPVPQDDGEWPDLVAGDGIFSNFTQTNEYLSPESYEIMQRVIRMVELAEGLNPLEFYGVTAAATTPFSDLPFYQEEEEKKDIKIREWVEKFLKDYRKDELDLSSDFWSMYIPRPPQKPDSEVPEFFNATLLINTEGEGEEGVEGEGGGPGGGPGGAPGGGGRAIGGNPTGSARSVAGEANERAATTGYF